MKNITSFILCILICTSYANLSPPEIVGDRVCIDTEQGFTYFAQSSTDLFGFEYAGTREIGALGKVYEQEINLDETRGFMRFKVAETNLDNPDDTDKDGFPDIEELKFPKSVSDPNNSDTDGNNVLDGDEDFDGDGIPNKDDTTPSQRDPAIIQIMSRGITRSGSSESNLSYEWFGAQPALVEEVDMNKDLGGWVYETISVMDTGKPEPYSTTTASSKYTTYQGMTFGLGFANYNATNADYLIRNNGGVQDYPITRYFLIRTEDTNPLVQDKEVTYELSSVTIPAGAKEPSESLALELRPSGGYAKSIAFLPVDLDIIHPATGELSESKEDINDGGYVSIKRESGGVDLAPITSLKVKYLSDDTDIGFRLKFSNGEVYKIFSDKQRTQEVKSEDTNLSLNQEAQFYFQGLSKSSSRGGEKATLQCVIDDQVFDTDSVSFTVVQSAFQIQLRAFIPFGWTEGEIPIPSLNPLKNVVAGGDSRDAAARYSNALSISYDLTPFRMMQEIVLTPFEDLNDSVDMESERKVQAAPASKHYDKNTQVPINQRSLRYGMGPMIGDPYKEGPAKINTETSPYYRDLLRDDTKTSASLNLGAKDGAMLFGDYISGLIPDINWTVNEVSVEISDTLNPEVKISGLHDRYPAYEVISLNSNNSFSLIYDFMPGANEFPGPYSLGGIDPIYFYGEN